VVVVLAASEEAVAPAQREVGRLWILGRIPMRQ
jgi:hypothetical protein